MNKRAKLMFIVSLFSAVTFISCNNDDEEDLVVQQGPNEMKLIFDSMVVNIDSVHLFSNPGEDFARIMKVHHRGAIDIGNKELEKGDDAIILEIARNMVDRNEVELLEFQDFLDGHTATESENGKTWDADAKVTLSNMKNNADVEILTGDADHDFALLMIHHHKAAIEMATSYLRFGENPNLRSLAQRLIDDQTKELTALQDWLSKTNV
jgi:uncharacterized protein (DUF305 family)